MYVTAAINFQITSISPVFDTFSVTFEYKIRIVTI